MTTYEFETEDIKTKWNQSAAAEAERQAGGLSCYCHWLYVCRQKLDKELNSDGELDSVTVTCQGHPLKVSCTVLTVSKQRVSFFYISNVQGLYDKKLLHARMRYCHPRYGEFSSCDQEDKEFEGIMKERKVKRKVQRVEHAAQSLARKRIRNIREMERRAIERFPDGNERNEERIHQELVGLAAAPGHDALHNAAHEQCTLGGEVACAADGESELQQVAGGTPHRTDLVHYNNQAAVHGGMDDEDFEIPMSVHTVEIPAGLLTIERHEGKSRCIFELSNGCVELNQGNRFQYILNELIYSHHCATHSICW